jgi:hypothetical protein
MLALSLCAGALGAVEDQYKPWARAGYDTNQPIC